ncbi:histone deacetylase [Salibacter sp.]|uniref:histone deacetylase family protein n=1 Tax=Salibacter sp. TaxID=2010995 RepID=UPI0028701E68|nr:histone deacetylase [Salibacter sp.]MDR9399707.1 histone deacetylase [Salibacter sp.]MDR9488229.1 histone deacetylase [Salibacter sp.]
MLKIAWSKIYKHPLPENHRFPMEKYELLPQQLLLEGTVGNENFFKPEPISESLILSTHDVEYWQKLKTLSLSRKEERKTGFPLSQQLVDRELIITGGTVRSAKFALEHGAAMNIAGGTHHAYTNRGEGFCLLNDIAISANYLLGQNLARQILVVDLDVHQGNGTAQIFQNDDRVFTFSIHGEKNYPLKKEQSDLDIELPDDTGDKAYLEILRNKLPELVEAVNPDFVFFQTGVDVLADDKLGRLALTINGCKQRDEIVLETCYQNNLPVCMSMGGGYSKQLSKIIEAHANTYRLAQKIYF